VREHLTFDQLEVVRGSNRGKAIPEFGNIIELSAGTQQVEWWANIEPNGRDCGAEALPAA
jgi:hypothetical protein